MRTKFTNGLSVASNYIMAINFLIITVLTLTHSFLFSFTIHVIFSKRFDFSCAPQKRVPSIWVLFSFLISNFVVIWTKNIAFVFCVFKICSNCVFVCIANSWSVLLCGHKKNLGFFNQGMYKHMETLCMCV